jgi:hypothetical protein
MGSRLNIRVRWHTEYTRLCGFGDATVALLSQIPRQLNGTHDAILVSSGTVYFRNPKLTIYTTKYKPTVRVVCSYYAEQHDLDELWNGYRKISGKQGTCVVKKMVLLCRTSLVARPR